ncbi:YbjN domain-containing protein [Pelagibacterium montanilacus]|uniref:YbjN domain-containing protein n=1 Tax=Pelagibacterium montanilacus TaxID=2185280 RepID=UPI0013DF1A49|nr:YbjN domain-containing protein [Pelagibacterium montanilacus]
MVAILAAAALAATPVWAQELIDGNSVAEIEELLKERGEVTAVEEPGMDAQFHVTVDNLNYLVSFMTCSEAEGCEDVYLYARYEIPSDLETINAWNSEARFTRAYIDAEENSILELDINLIHGVTPDNFMNTMDAWELSMELFGEHLGAW